MAVGDYSFEEIGDYEHVPVHTFYHGRCEMFRILSEVGPLDYLSFGSDKDRDFLLYLMEDGEEFFMIGGMLVNPASITTHQTTSSVKVWPSITRQLPTTIPCKDHTVQDYVSCIISAQTEVIRDPGLNCVPFVLTKYFPGFEVCVDEKRMRASFSAIYVVIMDTFEQSESPCKKPCVRKKFETEIIPHPHMGRFLREKRDLFQSAAYFDRFDVSLSDEDRFGRLTYITFGTGFDLVSEQFLIHDFLTIVGTVGGALGLFLGLSCYQSFVWLLDRIVEGKVVNDTKLDRVRPVKSESKQGDEEEEEPPPDSLQKEELKARFATKTDVGIQACYPDLPSVVSNSLEEGISSSHN